MRTEHPPESFDVIVVGGSYAGQAAALQLARARRRVLVIDAGVRRNRFADASHGFLGQDGRPPAAIAETGRAQLLAYPTVQWREASVAGAEKSARGFIVRDSSGQAFEGQYLILATGVVDELPGIDGLAERWGRSAFHCPYCHGYELNQGRIGVIAVSAMSMHQAMMLPHWGEVTFLLNGSFEPDAAQRAELARRSVAIEAARIRRIDETATVELADGRRLAFAGLFVASRARMASPLAEQLGCAIEEGPMGAYIRTDETKETSVPGVFACGDAARMAGNVTFAVADGAQAGFGVHRRLIFGMG